jgi:hypothetical protein
MLNLPGLTSHFLDLHSERVHNICSKDLIRVLVLVNLCSLDLHHDELTVRDLGHDGLVETMDC